MMDVTVVMTTGTVKTCSAPVKSLSPTDQHSVFTGQIARTSRPTNSVKTPSRMLLERLKGAKSVLAQLPCLHLE